MPPPSTLSASAAFMDASSAQSVLSERAWAALPAGSNGEFALPPDLTTAIARGQGCRIWTHEGREMLDFSMGWGSALVGHAHPAVVGAVQNAVADGGNFASLNTRALSLAERLIESCPAVQRLRFCASGTEATAYAAQLARAFTGRPAILKCEGAYHGANAIGTAALFPQAEPDPPDALPRRATPTSHGSADHALYVTPFNDPDAARAAVAALGDRLAGVILEPLHRCTPPAPGFLEAVADAAKANGSLLIFDEVVTGFRLALGGAQERFDLDKRHLPDLVAYGKALGGSLPIGVIAGRADVMELVNEHRHFARDRDADRLPYVWFASSLGGNPVSSAAALAALDIYRQPETYRRLDALGQGLRDRIDHVLTRHQLPAKATGLGPLAQVAFDTGESHQSAPQATVLRQRLLTELFRRDVFVNPLGTKLYLSLAHTEADLDAFAQRLDDACSALHHARPRRPDGEDADALS